MVHFYAMSARCEQISAHVVPLLLIFYLISLVPTTTRSLFSLLALSTVYYSPKNKPRCQRIA